MRRPLDVPRPAPGQESVWDYPRPPRLEAVPQRVRVVLGGVTIADSVRALRVCETASPPTYYVPPDDVLPGVLEPAAGQSVCEWKGAARYWTARAGDRVAPRAAWSYPSPRPDFVALRDHVAFYPGRVDACLVGDEPVRPQAGGFYGGWITANLVGPFKGEPGTEGW
jgi:uncharacterized protein (DUF427 family)